jgi:CRISPR-associated protein Cmr4
MTRTLSRTLLFLYAEAPVHPGADSSLGVLDLPVQREAATNLPVIWGQSVEGALRDHCRRAWDAGIVKEIFGSEPPRRADIRDSANKAANAAGSGNPVPGTLSVGDAQLVAFPAPTLSRTFAWATSPLALARTARKCRLADITAPSALPALSETMSAAADEHWSNSVALGPYVIRASRDDATHDWAGWLGRNALPLGDPIMYFRQKISTDLIAVTDEALAE